MNVNEYIRNVEGHISKTYAKIEFIGTLSHSCPNAPKEYTHNTPDNLISVFCRYSKRTLYYAQEYVKSLKSILYDLEKRNILNREEPVGTMIKDDIFYNFDAFIFSLKSIIEGNIIKKAQSLDEVTKNEFNRYGSKIKEDFIDTFLKPVRDEIVHLENYGTTSGSMIKIYPVNQIFIPTNFKNNNTNLDLLELFRFFTENTFDIISNILGLFILFNYNRWGVPEKDIHYQNYGHIICLQDFKIPGYCGINKQIR